MNDVNLYKNLESRPRPHPDPHFGLQKSFFVSIPAGSQANKDGLSDPGL